MEMIFGIIAFVVLFAAWVVIPTIIKKRRGASVEEEAFD
jgi:hypothetical protein